MVLASRSAEHDLMGAVLTEAPDDADACFRVSGESGAVECNVRTLSSDRDVVGSMHSDGALRLAIRCSPLFLESTLRDHHFGRMQGLAEISINNCKILRLPGNVFEGLRGLKTLKIRSMNNEWSNNKELELTLGAFNGLRELHTLDLAYNNIRKIPSDLFCALENIISLNLTQNKIKFVDELGFGHKCGSTLQMIDLSYNDIMSLPADSEILHLRRLTQLFLQNNKISELPGDVFNDLLSLKVVNLSDNAINYLPEGLFYNTREIREIYMQNNELEALPKRIFNRLEQLLVLDLSANKLRSDHIEDETFGGLIRLIVLDLSHNTLSRVTRNMFKDLFFLQILNLNNNTIGSIEDNAFSPLFNLHTLNLGQNKLHVIEDHVFNGLFILNKLNLNNNVISYISENAFKNCSDLKELDLSSNKMTKIPEALLQLPFLKSLDLGENLLTEITNNSFQNLSQLTGLRLIDNQIGNLTAGMFAGLPSLQVLNLAKNKIQSIETETFQRNTQLEAVRLDGNFISDINGVFVALTKLLWLNLSENHLVWFDYAFIPGSLKWLDIHANFIEILGNYYKIQAELHVKTLDASHNRLVTLSPMSIPNSVELLFINNNLISSIETDAFLEKRNLTRVDMYANEIESLDINSLRISRVPDDKALPEFYISANPFRCDCTMKWLLLINSITTRQYPRVMDLENVICKESFVRGIKYLPVSSLLLKDFLCKYDYHCPEDCGCCDFNNSLTGFMLILLILALVFTFRYACRMWLYSNCGIKLSPLTGAFKDADKLYDAYICYSPKDEEFVVESLARELESGYPSYHLCLHYRDVPQFEATYAQFPDLVVEATEASRRIIVVLTKNFILTEWSQIEFRQALQKALRKNPHKLIIVAVGLVPRDPELKSYFKTGLEITWKEKRFWERLRYAMPLSKRHGQKLKRLNYGRNSNTYTMDASVLNSTCQTLCGKSANSAERSPCDRPLSEHIYSTIDSDYSSTDFHGRHNQPQSVVLQHTVQTYLV
ncbi:unnamed protein product [Chilo suppressalis]|uniref:TIR domain-containing protein n=1 Tax=Chilo suppressalis TaxID=168631 RepID=A0ABN8AYQ2_CHISP|nr:unnamed protein product [Chilo suppressalis]